jgi:molybdopterin converting factor small subunit
MPSLRRPASLVLWLTASTLSVAAWSADPVTDALQKAYAPYRAALFKTNSGQAAESAEALKQAQQAWGQVTLLVKSQPTVPYANDTLMASTLSGVEAHYAKAAQQVAAGQLPQAHDTLEAVRDLLSELRRQNQVIVYSDHMNAYHAQMEHLLGEGPTWLKATDGLPKLAAQAGVLSYLAERLTAEAPAAAQASTEFKELLGAVNRSVAGLNTAVASGDKGLIEKAIGQVKAPYSKLFIKFG